MLSIWGKIISVILSILDFIETHTIMVGIISAIITSGVWFRKYLKQKRAEAFFGFYTKLLLTTAMLKQQLFEDMQLNVDEKENGNIFSLLYTKDSIKEFCPRYHILDDDKINFYCSISRELKKLILESNDNVYPKNYDKKVWYESQYIILLFCEFLDNPQIWYKDNVEFEEGHLEPKHIEKCKLLLEAMDSLQSAIEKIEY